jgi:hypothetical protein
MDYYMLDLEGYKAYSRITGSNAKAQARATNALRFR